MAWKVTRTVRVRLEVPDDRKSDLHATNDRFHYCANRTSEWAWRYPDEDCITSKSKAEDALYEDLREETDYLHANLVQKAIKRAIKDIDNAVDRLADAENVSQPEYTTFSLVYDKRAATYHRDHVSLATPNGRVECEYDLPENPEGTPHGEYLLNEDYSFSTSTVHYDSEADEFYLNAVMKQEFDVESPEKAEDSKVLGVDCNVDDHIAVTSTGKFVGNADYLNHQRREFEKRRASLQQMGTRSAHLTYQRIGDRFGRWSRDSLHRVSKEIVQEACRHDCTHIAFENLERIREHISDSKKFQQWAFNAVQTQVAYKAEEYGIVVKTVNPQYTSQQCSKCGCTLEENRDGQHFECLDCSYTANSDYNAAKNVARKLALKLQRGQKSPTGGAFCQYALKSGTMTVNASDVASDTYVSAERESTDKPTASAVGS
ncbi:transposase, IS605 OrfB family [Haloterrigena turkmenica DSM 5511]|uniref:Transposase, IS605 OrfB family n=1 Tax=Haloterrigena turkmenica (strain ATCC 51198 / DSM 5511 / JCM 9101 / NCIMB 13204 / VKM B-1734 / 4k) TaxID=543526 RepID=D2RZI5_HALTV|nr:RNA-guided endonuclease TnpB family protein [Haloterrigena turkmenica]ADB62024.1 transposase, IS605 OrfB family [Haloterrigena turkmenica DSM 5511]